MAIETNELIDVQTLPPFKRFIMTIGAIPSSYLESMTYGEQLMWFCNYLQETVIPTVNNNGLAVEELQNLYEELKSYVDDYFTNLDVQEEINNKLDSMATDGSLYNIINNQIFGEINNKLVQNSEDIGTLNQKMDDTIKITDTNVITNAMLSQEVREALTGGSTAVVSDNSITTDNIQNGAITVLKLDDILEKNFTKEYLNVDYTASYQGAKYANGNNELTTSSSTAYKYAEIALDNNTYYYFSGFNAYSFQGIIVVDESDNNTIVFKSPITSTSNAIEKTNLIFRTNKSGLKAYINMWASAGGVHPLGTILLNTLCKLNNAKLNELPKTFNAIRTLEDYYANNSTSASLQGEPGLSSLSGMSVKIYKLSKGTKYTVKADNLWGICGLIITNEEWVTSYKSSDSNVASKTSFTYSFTASNNGYALLSYGTAGSTTLSASISIDEIENRFANMKWCLIGDSLTDANSNPSVKKYYEYVQDDLGLSIQNLGQSGCGYKRKYNSGNNFVEQSLLIDSDADIVTLFGSWNDGNEFTNLGEVTDTTTDTVLGSVYVAINNIITNNPHTRIGVILPTPWESVNPNNISATYKKYIDGIKTIAEKNSVPVLDLFHKSNLYPWINGFKSSFFVSGDGVHPNSDGNKQFAYKIEEFIKSL